MPETRNIYDTEELLGVFVELRPVRRFWRRWFPGSITSDRKEIFWNTIFGNRLLAPLVLPTVPGVPTWGARERVESVAPAYLKPKDALDASEFVVRRAGLGELGQLTPLTQEQRYNATVAAILQHHWDIIERWEEWACSQILLNGKITLENDGSYPEREVDFRRHADNTVTLAADAARVWSTAGADIVSDLETWNNRMARASFGGACQDILFGGDAWDSFRKNPSALKLLDTQIRGTDANFNIGVGDGEPVQFRGRFSGNFNLWTYADQYETGSIGLTGATPVDYMNSKDILMLAAPARLQSSMAYGAIQDFDAQLRPTPIFPKMWRENDPSATVIMTQSAPLPVLVHPNGTLKARVLA